MLDRALYDLGSPNIRHRQESIDFFEDNVVMFSLWSDIAGLDPKFILKFYYAAKHKLMDPRTKRSDMFALITNIIER